MGCPSSLHRPATSLAVRQHCARAITRSGFFRQMFCVEWRPDATPAPLRRGAGASARASEPWSSANTTPQRCHVELRPTSHPVTTGSLLLQRYKMTPRISPCAPAPKASPSSPLPSPALDPWCFGFIHLSLYSFSLLTQHTSGAGCQGSWGVLPLSHDIAPSEPAARRGAPPLPRTIGSWQLAG